MSYENLDERLPVLNAVVESGNESIIESSRLGRKVLRELDMLQQSKPVSFVLHEHILEEGGKSDNVTRLASQFDPETGHSDANNAQTIDSEDELELMIDQIVDRHIHELRRDIRRLLIHVKQEP